MADHEATGCAAESSVGDQRHAFAEAFSYDGRGYAQHFAHAGTTFWAFVADHDYVSGFDLFACYGLHRGFFGVEDARGAGVRLAFVGAHLYDSTTGSEVAFQDYEPARRF